MANNLFQFLDKPDEKNEGKTPIGYTVKTYQGVLAALQQAKVKVVDVQGGANTTGAAGNQNTKRYFTILGNTTIDTKDVNDNGFVFQGGDVTKPLYQAICTLKDYMTFPVDYNSGQQNEMGYISVDRGGALSTGSAQKGGVTFPCANMTPQIITSMKRDCDKFYVGVGVSLNTLVANFFKTYFSQQNISNEKIAKMISSGHLYAQVIVPQRGNNARVLHAKVTINTQQSNSGPNDVWIPIPILMTDDFSDLGSIRAKIGGKQQLVNNGSITSPLKGQRYYHKDASITGFTPNTFQQYSQNKGSYCGSTMCSAGKQTIGRVRFYFDQAAKGTIGSDNQQLYRGTLTSGQVTSSQIVQSNISTFNATGGVFLDVGHSRSNSTTQTGGTGADGVAIGNAPGSRPDGKRNEYYFNRDIAQALASVLTEKGIPVKIVDYPSPISSREKNKVKNEFIASQQDYAMFVSIHCNADDSSSPGGSQVDVSSNGNAKSMDLGTKIAQSLGKAIDAQRVRLGARPGRNTKTKPVVDNPRAGILNGMATPACLIQCGFITSPIDARILTEKESLKRIVNAIANGIELFLNSNR